MKMVKFHNENENEDGHGQHGHEGGLWCEEMCGKNAESYFQVMMQEAYLTNCCFDPELVLGLLRS